MQTRVAFFETVLTRQGVRVPGRKIERAEGAKLHEAEAVKPGAAAYVARYFLSARAVQCLWHSKALQQENAKHPSLAYRTDGRIEPPGLAPPVMMDFRSTVSSMALPPR
jgi:hypothetical protein